MGGGARQVRRAAREGGILEQDVDRPNGESDRLAASHSRQACRSGVAACLRACLSEDARSQTETHRQAVAVEAVMYNASYEEIDCTIVHHIALYHLSDFSEFAKVVAARLPR